MKKSGGILLVLALIVGTTVIKSPEEASAAACNDTKQYGAVRLAVPPLPKAGSYQLWVRMQSPTNTAKVQLELNQLDCYEVDSTMLSPNTWAWIPYYTDNQNRTIIIANPEGNIFKLIGVQANVKVDKVLLTDPACVPEGFGNNCNGSSEPTLFNQETVRPIDPPSSGSVSGKVILSQTPYTLEQSLRTVSYSAGGRTLQTAEQAVPFDTVLLENGKHTILIKTTLDDGTVIQESTVLTINNPQTVLAPVLRWLRRNQETLVIVSAGLALFAVIAALVGYARRSYRMRRERRFHGF
jgi:hypothetical protein